jgi:hypothetical protein
MRGRLKVIFGVFVIIGLVVTCVLGQDKVSKVPQKNEFIGEFSGWQAPVPFSNYYFVQGAIMVFGTKWGESPQTEQELQDRVWEQLVLSFEAFRRDIKVEDKELEEEIDKMVKAEKVAFDWKKDKQAFSDWVKEKTKENVELFQNQLRHLIQLEKLRKEVLDTFKPQVTEVEAKNEFINEYNTIELELKQFDQLKDAEVFYQKMKDPKSWVEEGKKDPKFFQHPGFVSFEFLIHMWKIPKDDLYRMLTMDIDAIYPPVPVYKGYGVMRILKKRQADPAEFPKVRESYLKQVEMIKKYDQLKEWLKNLKQDAGIKIYPANPQMDKPKS